MTITRTSIYDKRIKLIKSGKKNPTQEELKEAYGYLDSCYYCGKEFTIWDRLTFNIEHSMFGNSHRRKCSREEKVNDNLS